MIYPDEFEKLKESFQLLPGVGEKSAERYVYAVNEIDIDKIEEFAANLNRFKENMRKCKVCGHLTNKEICNICDNEHRDKSTICVVEDSKSVFMFANTYTIGTAITADRTIFAMKTDDIYLLALL